MHSKFFILALMPSLIYSADLTECLVHTPRTRTGVRADEGLTCLIAQNGLTSGAQIVEVAVPNMLNTMFQGCWNRPNRSHTHGMFTLWNALQLMRLQQDMAPDERLALTNRFYTEYIPGITPFTQPLMKEETAPFDADYLHNVLSTMSGVVEPGAISFVDTPDAQPFLSNPFATRDGNVLGQYHALLTENMGNNRFAHGVVFNCPPTAYNPDKGNRLVSIVVSRKDHTNTYFVAHAGNFIPTKAIGPDNEEYYHTSLLREVPEEHNPVRQFIQRHLEQPNPVYCFADPSDDVTRLVDLSRLNVNDRMQE